MRISRAGTTKAEISGHQCEYQAAKLRRKTLVPKKGLEPPHPCEYMDLNHARLPIPPLRHLGCTVTANAVQMKGATVFILSKIPRAHEHRPGYERIRDRTLLHR